MSRPSLSTMMPRVQTVSSVYAMIRSSYVCPALREPQGRLELRRRAALAGPELRFEIVLRHDERRGARSALVLGDRDERCFLAQALEIGARELFGPARQIVDVDVGRQRNLPAAQADDGGALGGIRLRKTNDIVEPAAPQERRLDAFGPVRRGDEHDAFDVAQIVDFAQQLT